jgi:hypothetical protein
VRDANGAFSFPNYIKNEIAKVNERFGSAIATSVDGSADLTLMIASMHSDGNQTFNVYYELPAPTSAPTASPMPSSLYLKKGLCEGDQYIPFGQSLPSACTPCPANHIASNVTSNNCDCFVGYHANGVLFAENPTAGRCQLCPRGSICPERSVVPQLCPIGDTTTAEGSTECEPCPLRATSNAEGICVSCGASQQFNRATRSW